MSRASYILKWNRSDGSKINFGTLFPNGDLNTNYVVDYAKQSGDPQVGVDYLETVARLVRGATVKKDGNYWTWRVVVDGSKPKIGDLLEHSNEWLAAIGQTVKALQSARRGLIGNRPEASRRNNGSPAPPVALLRDESRWI